jgi:hypothetical protein
MSQEKYAYTKLPIALPEIRRVYFRLRRSKHRIASKENLVGNVGKYLAGKISRCGFSFGTRRPKNIRRADLFSTIEISPAMMAAGAEALSSHYFDLVDSVGYPEIARTVFEAMVARIEKFRFSDVGSA